MPLSDALTHLQLQRLERPVIRLPSFRCSKCWTCDPMMANETPRAVFWDRYFLVPRREACEEKAFSPAARPLLPLAPALPTLDTQVTTPCLKLKQPFCNHEGTCLKMKSHLLRRERWKAREVWVLDLLAKLSYHPPPGFSLSTYFALGSSKQNRRQALGWEQFTRKGNPGSTSGGMGC